MLEGTCEERECMVRCGAVYIVYVYSVTLIFDIVFFFFQAEDGIRDLVRSRGLGDVYKRQILICVKNIIKISNFKRSNIKLLYNYFR